MNRITDNVENAKISGYAVISVPIAISAPIGTVIAPNSAFLGRIISMTMPRSTLSSLMHWAIATYS